MPWLTFFAVYFVIWWLCLFAVLPFGVRNQVDAGDVTPGTDPGAPAVLRLWRSIGIASLLAGVITLLLIWGYTNPWLQQYWA